MTFPSPKIKPTQDSFRYYRLKNAHNIRWGKYDLKVSHEMQQENVIESFAYAHNENTSSNEFSMTNEISISGLISVFEIGFDHSHTFSRASSESISTGSEIRKTSTKHVSRSETFTRTVEQNYFLAVVEIIEVVCFTVNGGKRQYARIPLSLQYLPMGIEEMKNMLQTKFLMDSDSWSLANIFVEDLEFDDIPNAMRNLKPRNIEMLVPFGTYKIKTTEYSETQPAGWGLSASRISDGVRHGSSTWVSCHRNDACPCLWEFKPGREHDTYRIETKLNTTEKQPAGWGLSAFHIGTAAMKGNTCTRVAVHEGVGWPMDWKIVEGNKEGTVRIITTDHFEGSQEAGWHLSSLGTGNDYERDNKSCWVYVHSQDGFGMDWVLEKQD